MLSMRKQNASTRDSGKVRRGPVPLLFLLLSLLIPLTTLSAPYFDGDAPQIVVQPHESNGVSRDVIVRAVVQDPDGVGTVTVWARGEKESEFAGYSMKSTGAGEWTGRIPPLPTRGRSVAYFVEATDRHGNGPGRAGSPVDPFVVHLEALPAAAVPQVAGMGWHWYDWGLLALCVLAVAFLVRVLLSFRGKRTDHAELDFWCNLLSPLSDKTGGELSRRIERLCERYHDHPNLGRIRLKREEVLLWLGTIRRCEPERLYLMRRINREYGETGLGYEPRARTATHRELAEDNFWYEMLLPLLDMSRAETTTAIHVLASRPHIHPARGIMTPDPKALRERLRWVAEAHAARSRPASGKMAGATLPELLVVVAIIGMVAGAATLYLKPMAAPVHSAAVLVEGLVKQTRAKSMSTTSSYRVRPFTANQLVVEYAANCSEVAWTLDPRMDLSLPTGVTVSNTGWSVCFNSRGTASDNVVLVLDHPDHGSQSLEILMGGAVRWHER